MQRALSLRRIITVAAVALLGPALLTGTAQAAGLPTAAPRPVAAAGTWGTAREVTGVNAGGDAGIAAVSCGSAGNCAAGGTYDTNGTACDYVGCHFSAFVVSEVRGAWGRAAKVGGMQTLNRGRSASVDSVSCASAGTCAAGGYYTDRSRHDQAFVVSQVHGRWGTAREVPGTAALDQGGSAVITSVSCPSAGTCAAAGHYTDRSRHVQGFVVSQVHGRWGTAREIPGMGAIGWVSCASAGNCTAAGGVFVVSQVHGHWGTARQIPGLAALAATGSVQISSLSCGSAGNCAATANYSDEVGNQYPYLASQVNGTWGQAVKVPGMAALGQGGQGQVFSVSCASARSCSAGGLSGANNGFDVGGGGQPFVVSRANGTWGSAQQVPGIGALNTGVDGQVSSMSCAAPGDCAAAGYYGVGSPGNKVYNLEVFVASQVNGTWGRARQIPGTAALNQAHWAGISQVSCAAPGRCSAGGSYEPDPRHSNIGRSFVVSQG
jgi:hypothetical protein